MKAPLVLAALLAGCTFARTDVSVAKDVLEHVPTRIVVGPNCGPLGDAIGGLLLKYGFDIYDSNQISAVVARANLTEVEVYQPENLRLLKDRGIDAVLQIRTVGAGYDNRPQSATARLISTEDAPCANVR